MRLARTLAAVALCASGPVFAYRPFDGTDAAVAERGKLEIELGPIGLLREGPEKFLVVPAVIANYGFAENLEVVLEGRHHYLLGEANGEPRPRLVDTALNLKAVVRPGELQEYTGPSIAAEVGILLPTVNDEPGVGAQGTVIVSRQFWNAVVHLNAGFAYTRAHNADLVGSIIVEGPPRWPVKPVFELFSEDELGGPSAVTGLVGMIWRKSDALTFDAGIRVGRAAGEGLVEGRLGLTFSVDLLSRR